MDGLRIFLLEAEVAKIDVQEGMHSRGTDDGSRFVSVGVAFVRGNWIPSYLPTATVARTGQVKREDGLYIEVMVSDARAKDVFCGVGAALIQEVREFGRSCGKKVLYLDGWAGNGEKLIR